jgi:DNA-binding NtrC family response regulator
MLKTIRQALETGRFMRSPVDMGEGSEKTDRDSIVGRSDAMQQVFKMVGRVASTDATVLIRGETGTGKELVARAIYQHSQRAGKPFLVINCVALPETLLESELFGYEKGAFTGAAHRRLGKIEQAGGGTVFLDEIGDMPVNLQTKILRLLQEKKIERLGGRETIPVDVRIIAATNRDLEGLITQAQFREDLYYRLKVITIELPPLRERIADIPLLTEYFLDRFAKELGVDNPGITKNALALLAENAWPGNVRELANTLQKTLIFNRGAPIDPNDIAAALAGRECPTRVETGSLEGEVRRWFRETAQSKRTDNLFDSCMDFFARILVQEALRFTDGNRSRAAKLLGVSRPTLHAKIDKYRLKIETSISQADP